jgi:hypothetical protein
VAALPLSTLISQVVVALTIELDNEFERRFREAGGGARITSLTMWSNLLRFVADGITVREFVAAVGLPRASVLSRVGGLERWGYVSVGPSNGKREGYGSARGVKDEWVVQFTTAGRKAAGIWPALPDEIEARWRGRFGAAEIDDLIGALRVVDEGIDAHLPDSLPVVSSTNGMSLELGQQKLQNTVDLPMVGRPLVVLLAHALMAYILDFEGGPAMSLPLSANVFRVVDTVGVPIRELPSLTGISKEAVAVSLTSLARTDYVIVEGTQPSKRTIRLTSTGETLRTIHLRLHARIGRSWAKRFGSNVVEQLQVALERILDHPQLADGLSPYPDGWRASKPYADRTEALLANPRPLLPHCPMVLHRGGWPDGS